VVTAIPPYVPTADIEFLPRDFREHEPRLALDGGPDGTELLRPAVRAASLLLHPGGVLLLELGGDQDEHLGDVLGSADFDLPRRWTDSDGDLRAIEAHRR
jgi:release factor glutamine methyltransferase